MKESKKPSNKKLFKKHIIACIIFTLFTIGFTLLIKNVGTGEVVVSEPTGEVATSTSTTVGFYITNTKFRSSIGYNETWYKITKYSGYLLVVPVVALMLLGAYQLFKRKGFKKVDRELKLLIPFYAAVAAVYLFFEKVFVVNYRPFLMYGELEPSYPSSHTLFAICVCCSSMMVIARLLREKRAKLAIFINLALTVLMILTVVGRLLSGVHWITDILGGFFIASTLLLFLATFLQYEPKQKKAKEKE